MKPAFYAATGAFHSRRLSAVLEEAREAGCDHLELSSGVTPETNDFQLAMTAREAGVAFLVHNYYPAPEIPFVLNLASELPDSLRFCERAVDLCVKLGSPYYSVHAGFGVELDPCDLGNPQAFQEKLRSGKSRLSRETFSCTVETLAGYAKNRGVRILLENNVLENSLIAPDWDALFLSDPDELARFFTQAPRNTGLLLDLAHLQVTCRTLGRDFDAACRQLAPFVIGLHVSSAKDGRDSNAPLDSTTVEYQALRHFSPAFAVLEVYRIGAQAVRNQMALLAQGLAKS